MNAGTEMPRYKSHKEVWALKIEKLEASQNPNADADGALTMTPAEPGFGPVELAPEYVRKHRPQVGGYYVVYADGYKSWSPAKAFEDGYTRV